MDVKGKTRLFAGIIGLATSVITFFILWNEVDPIYSFYYKFMCAGGACESQERAVRSISRRSHSRISVFMDATPEPRPGGGS